MSFLTTSATIPSCQLVDSSSNPPPPLLITAKASTRASSRKNRVYVLREFLVKTYPQLFHADGSSVSSSSSTILDVAGGKGDLSWLLRNVEPRMENVVVVDPRITKHKHLYKSIAYLKANPQVAKERSIPNRPTHQPLAALMDRIDDDGNFHAPKHLRLLVNEDLVQAIRSHLNDTKDVRAWNAFWVNASNQARQAQPLGYREEDMEHADSTIHDANVALDTLLNVQLIVGFHPDQATEACIDLALLLGIPYCIVPCCVFPSEFPNRLTQEGQRVRSYDELIPYLKAKDPQRVQTATLGFHGDPATARRIVLYRN